MLKQTRIRDLSVLYHD